MSTGMRCPVLPVENSDVLNQRIYVIILSPEMVAKHGNQLFKALKSGGGGTA